MMVPVGSYLWKRQSIHIIDFHHSQADKENTKNMEYEKAGRFALPFIDAIGVSISYSFRCDTCDFRLSERAVNE